MGLREWIIVLAILLMAVVAFDAWRRVKRQRRYHGSWVKPSTEGSVREDQGKPRVSRVPGKPPRTEPAFETETEGGSVNGAGDHELADSTDALVPDDRLDCSSADESYEPEPSTAERVSAETPASDANRQNTNRHRSISEARRQSQGAHSPDAQRRPLDLSRKVPVLVDSLETEADSEPEQEFNAADETQYEFDLQPPNPDNSTSRKQSTVGEPDSYESGFDALDAAERSRDPRGPDFTTDPDDVLLSSSAMRTSEGAAHDSHSHLNDDLQGDAGRSYESESPGPQVADSRRSPAVDDEDDWEEEEIEDPVLAEAESRQLNDEEVGEQLLAEPETVLVVTVLAREDTTFEGANLLSILLACGMRFGNMNIFHATDDHGRLQYSAANAFNPGTFDLDNVEHFETRGVTFFLQLPCQGNPMDAFDAMMHSANTLATHLDGDVFDESRSVMTTQTLTHYRERIREHQRAQLMKRA